MFGTGSYGEVTYGLGSADQGEPIIPEVTEATSTLVFVIEIDAIGQPEE